MVNHTVVIASVAACLTLLLQESFIEQLDALQSLDQLAPLTAAKEPLLCDIINILQLLGKADNIPFN